MCVTNGSTVVFIIQEHLHQGLNLPRRSLPSVYNLFSTIWIVLAVVPCNSLAKFTKFFTYTTEFIEKSSYSVLLIQWSI